MTSAKHDAAECLSILGVLVAIVLLLALAHHIR